MIYIAWICKRNNVLSSSPSSFPLARRYRIWATCVYRVDPTTKVSSDLLFFEGTSKRRRTSSPPRPIYYQQPHFEQHVFVKASVVDVESGLEQKTNDFKFTWCCDDETDHWSTSQLKEPIYLQRMVVPQTYAGMSYILFVFVKWELGFDDCLRLSIEAMLWIEGRRALEMGEEIRGLRRTSE